MPELKSYTLLSDFIVLILSYKFFDNFLNDSIAIIIISRIILQAFSLHMYLRHNMTL